MILLYAPRLRRRTMQEILLIFCAGINVPCEVRVPTRSLGSALRQRAASPGFGYIEHDKIDFGTNYEDLLVLICSTKTACASRQTWSSMVKINGARV